MSNSSSPPTPTSGPLRGQGRFKRVRGPLEWIENYRPGGYHPVHLHDRFKSSRYEVIRKLGAGSFSTVWLAIDHNSLSYVALKIAMAKVSKPSHELAILQHLSNTAANIYTTHVVRLLDQFDHEGPNGVHSCLVFEPMGASVSRMAEDLPGSKGRGKYPIWMVKRMLEHVLKGLAFLHQNKIVHGDLQPGNMLFTPNDLSQHIGKNKLLQDKNFKWGSISSPVERIDGKVDKWSPRYLAVPQPLTANTNISETFTIKLSDFGGAFFISNPPKNPVTPLGLRAPELIFRDQINEKVDMWSFGCLLFEMVTNTPLFTLLSSTREDEDDAHILQLIDILGPLPQGLYNNWSRSSKYFTPYGVQFNSYVDEVPEDVDPLSAKSKTLEEYFDESKPGDMTDEDAEAVKALIRQILQYDPAKRPAASEVLRHPWFGN